MKTFQISKFANIVMKIKANKHFVAANSFVILIFDISYSYYPSIFYHTVSV